MTLRSSSIAMLVLSVLAPATWIAFFSWNFSRWAETRAGGVCGMPLLGAWGLGLLTMCLLSLVALGLGVGSFVRLPAPRPRRRRAELLLLASPLLVAASFVAVGVLWN